MPRRLLRGERDLLKCKIPTTFVVRSLTILDDDCYSEAATGYPDTDYTLVESPSGRYANMAAALLATRRPILFAICDWGVDFPSAWAPAVGNSWRITNDIIPSYRTLPRILN